MLRFSGLPVPKHHRVSQIFDSAKIKADMIIILASLGVTEEQIAHIGQTAINETICRVWDYLLSKSFLKKITKYKGEVKTLIRFC